MTELFDQIKEIVGPRGWTDDSAEMQPYLTEWRGAYESHAGHGVAGDNRTGCGRGQAVCERQRRHRSTGWQYQPVWRVGSGRVRETDRSLSWENEPRSKRRSREFFHGG